MIRDEVKRYYLKHCTIIFTLFPLQIAVILRLCVYVSAHMSARGSINNQHPSPSMQQHQGRQQWLCKRCFTIAEMSPCETDGEGRAGGLHKSDVCCLDWGVSLAARSIIQAFKYVHTRTQARATCVRAWLWDRGQWRAVITPRWATLSGTQPAGHSISLFITVFLCLLTFWTCFSCIVSWRCPYSSVCLSVFQVGLFNFRPSVRPVPLEVHIQGFPGQHYCPRMASMNKPVFQGTIPQ